MGESFEEWVFEVDRQLRIRTKKSVEDLKIDDKTLYAAFVSGASAFAFVIDHIKDRGLIDFTEGTY